MGTFFFVDTDGIDGHVPFIHGLADELDEAVKSTENLPHDLSIWGPDAIGRQAFNIFGPARIAILGAAGGVVEGLRDMAGNTRATAFWLKYLENVNTAAAHGLRLPGDAEGHPRPGSGPHV